jgi:DNA-binding GntR family transcriptional regulator
MPLPSEIAPIDRQSARITVFDLIRNWVEEGMLAPGEAIRDAEIAALLGVSRTPVREALQMLERDGVVEMLPGRQTRVVEISPEDVARLYAPLGALMAAAAEIAATRATKADIAEMTAHNERLLAALDSDPLLAGEADRALHTVPVRVADNEYLTTALGPLMTHLRRLEALYFKSVAVGRASYDEHADIIAAIAAGDSTAAGDLTRHNYKRYWRSDVMGDGSGGVGRG